MGCASSKECKRSTERLALSAAEGATRTPALLLLASAPPGWPARRLKHVMVSGAGEAQVSGIYTQDGVHDGVAKYSNLQQVSLMRYRFRSGNPYWFLTFRDQSGKPSLDKDFYRTALSESPLPPEEGWVTTADNPPTVGPRPLPRIVCCFEDAADAARAAAPPALPFPASWVSPAQGQSFRTTVAPSKAVYHQVEELLSQTYLRRATRDRRRSKVPSRLHLRNLQRFESSSAWQAYSEKKAQIIQRRGKCPRMEELPGCEGRPVLTHSFFASRELSAECNEFFLWHGTKPGAAMGIVDTGFLIEKAGMVHGAMFGRGAYFGESSCKADEYAEDSTGLHKGLFAMLLCRVCCGKLHYTLHPDADTIEAERAAGVIDGVLGDRERAVGTYREFVVFDQAQVYPEFMFVYAREYDDEAE